MIAVRFFSRFLSILFHPLFLVTYLLLSLLLVNPYLFGVNDWQGQNKFLLLVFISTAFLPAVSILIMKGLGLIRSIQMESAKDRIGPYIATAIFYTWLFRNLLDNPEIPKVFISCVLGATLALFMDFVINNFSKISAHATGMGGFVSLAIILENSYNPGSFFIKTSMFGHLQISMLLFLIAMILIAGAVCTARLFLRAHTFDQVAGGFLVGFCAQVIAYLIIV